MILPRRFCPLIILLILFLTFSCAICAYGDATVDVPEQSPAAANVSAPSPADTPAVEKEPQKTPDNPSVVTTPPASTPTAKKIRVLIMPDIKLYERGVQTNELRDDWVKVAQEHILGGISEKLKSRGMELVEFKPIPDIETEVDEVKALYGRLSFIYYKKSQGANFGAKGPVDYNVGPIESIINRAGGDYLLLVTGFDVMATTGRNISKILLRTLAAALGTIITSFGDVTYLNVALVEPSGKVAWQQARVHEIGYDLRDAEKTGETHQ